MKKQIKWIIPVLIVFAIFMLYRKYFFYSTSNVRFQDAVDSHLSFFYGSKEFTCLNKTMNVFKENGLYRFEYVATMTDGEIEFEAIDNMYDRKRIGGHLFKDDYWDVRDNYARKKLENEGVYLQQYENDFREAVANNKPDYEFIISENDNEEVIELIKQVMSLGIADYKLDLWFEVYDENGEVIVDSYTLWKECKRNKMTEPGLKAFIQEQLEQGD